MNDEPLACFLTWTTYGSWLPGDERGWVKWHGGFQQPDEQIRKAAAAKMVETVLDDQQRDIVEQTITRQRSIDDEDSLEAAIQYVLDGQGTPPQSKRV